MSVAYDPKSFIHEGAYPPLGDDHDHDHDHDHDSHAGRLTDNDVAEQLQRYTNEVMGVDERDLLNDGPDMQQIDISAAGFPSPVAAPVQPDLEQLPPVSESASPIETSPRAPSDDASRGGKTAKPVRQVAKKADGKYHCPNEDCTEEVKKFNRRCEWNKHMDKHERPYVCTAPGCEGLPGFTYSGGLLRHEREVHGKHGGPRNTVNCPHKSCKRHTGKGFSRMENLNEHLRRVHTSGGGHSPASPETGKRKRSLFDLLDDEQYERQLRQQARNADMENEMEKEGASPETSFREMYRVRHAEIMDALREMREMHLSLREGLRTAGLSKLADDLERMAHRQPLNADAEA